MHGASRTSRTPSSTAPPPEASWLRPNATGGTITRFRASAATRGEPAIREGLTQCRERHLQMGVGLVHVLPQRAVERSSRHSLSGGLWHADPAVRAFCAQEWVKAGVLAEHHPRRPPRWAGAPPRRGARWE